MFTPPHHHRSGPNAHISAIAPTRPLYNQHDKTTQRLGIKVAQLSSHEDQ
jgi:hypothetical protein